MNVETKKRCADLFGERIQTLVDHNRLLESMLDSETFDESEVKNQYLTNRQEMEDLKKVLTILDKVRVK